MEITLNEPRLMYPYVVQWVRDNGDKVVVRGLHTREATGVTLIAPDPTRPVLPVGVGRKLNTKFAAVDALSLVAGTHHGDLLDAAAPGWRRVLVDPERPELGAYGPRTRGQLDSCFRILSDDPTSRRALMAIWRPVDLLSQGDRPCTLTLQFLLREDGLQLHSNMRSQDVFLGLAYDLFTFTQLQLTLARWLNVPVGALVHHVASFHLYETDVPHVEELDFAPAPLNGVPLPVGVVGLPKGSFNPITAAKALLSGDAAEFVTTPNPWYAEQVAQIWEKIR